MMKKLEYLFLCAKKRLTDADQCCPSCGYAKSELVATKYLLTTLQRCRSCKLLFRLPATTYEENAQFYQSSYVQGFTTEMPNAVALENLKANRFKDSAKDYSTYIDVVATLVAKGSRVFDYGCSWGYGSWQLAKAGFEVEAYEISQPRREYAKQNLDVQVYDELPPSSPTFDVFFSAHVLEHVPSINFALTYGFSLLKPGGYFVAFTPNGSEEFRNLYKEQWMKLWGLVHPNFLDDLFYIYNSVEDPFLLTSNPYVLKDISSWATDSSENKKGPLAGSELLYIAKKQR